MYISDAILSVLIVLVYFFFSISDQHGSVSFLSDSAFLNESGEWFNKIFIKTVIRNCILVYYFYYFSISF